MRRSKLVRISSGAPQDSAHIAVVYARSRDQAESFVSELALRHQIKAQAFSDLDNLPLERQFETRVSMQSCKWPGVGL